MIIRKNLFTNYAKNIDNLIYHYRRKITILKSIVALTNIIFPSIALLLVIISTFNIAGGKYESPISGQNYIIFAAIISSLTALINSLITFFLLKDKIEDYTSIHYKLIIEKQRYQLNSSYYNNLKTQEVKEKKFKIQIFKIINKYDPLTDDEGINEKDN